MADEPKLPEIQKKIDDLSNRAKSPQTTSKEDQEKSTAEVLSLSAQMQGLLQKSEYGLMTGFGSGLAQAGIAAAAEKLTQAAGSIPGASMAGSQLGQMMKGYRERRRQGGSGGMDAESGGGVGRYSGGGAGGGVAGGISGAAGTQGGEVGATGGGAGIIDRSRFKAELANNPALRQKVMTIAANENNDPKAQQAIIESMMNRAAMRGKTLASEATWVTEGGYYDDRKGGRHRGQRAYANGDIRSGLEARLNGALGGSNVANYGTGNASGSFVEGKIQRGAYSRTAKFNGESFVTEGPGYQKWRGNLPRAPAGGGGEGAAAGVARGQAGSVIEQQASAGTRRGAITDQLRGQLQYAGEKTGLNFHIFSGGQRMEGAPGATGSHRHDFGKSADGYFTDKSGRKLNASNPEDRKQISEYIKHAVAAGATGIGAGPGYMEGHGGTAVHIGGGSPGTWGEGGHGANAPAWLQEAHAAGQTEAARHEFATRGHGKPTPRPEEAGTPQETKGPEAGKKGKMLFAHGMEDRYGNVSKAEVEAGAEKFAKAHGYSGIKAISSDDPKAVREALNDKDVTGVYGFSRGGNRLRTILQDPNTSADVKQRIKEAYLVGSPETKGDIPGIKTTDIPHIKDVDHMHMVQHLGEQAEKQAPQQTQPAREPRHIWPGEKPYSGAQKPLDATRTSTERVFGGPETSTVKTQWDVGHGQLASGTAFSLGDGYFMTHAHGINQSQIGLGMGDTHVHANVIHKSNTLDYAILKTSEADTTKLKGAGLTNLQLSGETPEKGATLTAHGYPHGGAFKDLPGTYTGTSEGGQLGGIGGGKGLGSTYRISPQDSRNLEARTVGASGGPVTDASGRVMGIQTGVSGPGAGTHYESTPMASILKDLPKGTIPQHILDNAMTKQREQQQTPQAAPERKQWPGEKHYDGPQRGLEEGPKGADDKPARGQPSQKAADGTKAPQATRAAEQARGSRMHIPGKSLAGVDPELRGRLEAAYRAAPASAKAGFQVLSGRRSTELQAKLYARYQAGKGGIAARPGHSMHEKGGAIDIRDPSGWFHKHGREYGIYAPMGHKDWPHMQKDPSWHGHTATPTSYQDTRAQQVKSSALKEKTTTRPGQKPPEPRQPHKEPQQRQQPYHHHPHQKREEGNWASKNHASPAADNNTHVREGFHKRSEPMNNKFGDKIA